MTGTDSLIDVSSDDLAVRIIEILIQSFPSDCLFEQVQSVLRQVTEEQLLVALDALEKLGWVTGGFQRTGALNTLGAVWNVRLTDAGRQWAEEQGVFDLPRLNELGDRLFDATRRTLYEDMSRVTVDIAEDCGHHGLTRSSVFARRVTDAVFDRFAKLNATFIESYIRTVVDTDRGITRVLGRWLTRKLDQVWDAEVTRARDLASTLAQSTGMSDADVRPFVVAVENKARDLSKDLLNQIEIAVLAKPRGNEAHKPEPSLKKMDSVLPIFDKSEFRPDLAALVSKSSAASPATVLMLDLDKFKTINDTAGHDVGDKALECVADVLRRVGDAKGGSAYRYGGDEFCVLLRNHSTNEGTAVAERIRREIRSIRMDELPDGLSMSIGVACFPESTGDPSQLFELADAAMYKSKNAGGNRVPTAEAITVDAPVSTTSRLTPEQIQDRIAAVELDLKISEACWETVAVNVQNKSDESLVIKKIKISYNGVKLTEMPVAGANDDWSIGPRGRGYVAWKANPVPATKLMELLRTFDRSSEAVLEVVIHAEILGRLRICESRIHVQVEPGSKRIWQL
jgi:diguanylate cyclase (GGDEF)-like protein